MKKNPVFVPKRKRVLLKTKIPTADEVARVLGVSKKRRKKLERMMEEIGKK
jgi:hypothetical protein